MIFIQLFDGVEFVYNHDNEISELILSIDKKINKIKINDNKINVREGLNIIAER